MSQTTLSETRRVKSRRAVTALWVSTDTKNLVKAYSVRSGYKMQAIADRILGRELRKLNS